MNLNVVKSNGTTEPYQLSKTQRAISWACKDLDVSASAVEVELGITLYDGVQTKQIHEASIRAAAGLISKESPDYSKVAARLLLLGAYKEATGGEIKYPPLADAIKYGVKIDKLSDKLLKFDLDLLNSVIDPTRDFQFEYQGMGTIIDRYLLRDWPSKSHAKGQLIELPQHFFMRVAMGLALEEENPDYWAIEFYHILSSFDFMSSTPTLFNSGTKRSQLSSCYLNQISDRLYDEYEGSKHASIYGTIEECARFSKWAGGVGTDFTPVRHAGALIKSTGGKSAGPVPYLKVYNDTAVAVNQGGKRKGAFAPYMQPWHPDFTDFIELRKPVGDERLRAHDIHPASWIPNEFMRRVKAKEDWHFIKVDKAPELIDLYGEAFDKRYNEIVANEPEKIHKTMPALQLWRKMLTMLWETGYPWINFKDACNLRSPQDHVGVVHNSNLCTEITLNTNEEESAVCNLGSVNLAKHMQSNGDIDYGKLHRTIRIAMRMLDNVVDINFYPSERAKRSNLRHRPVGLGAMGYEEAMAIAGIPFDSEEHLVWADSLFEAFSYYAVQSSCELAQERGAYESFPGSKWQRGLFPIDTVINKEAVAALHSDEWVTLDWDALKELVKQHGMRNSNCMAIAPTATISNIVGTTPCIEPSFKLEWMESNLGGDFVMFSPSLRHMPADKLRTATEIDQMWLIKGAAIRGKWIDQSQSLNLHEYSDRRVPARELESWYIAAFDLGLKTTYYLRRQSQKAQTTQDADAAAAEVGKDGTLKVCAPDAGPNCESCQ